MLGSAKFVLEPSDVSPFFSAEATRIQHYHFSPEILPARPSTRLAPPLSEPVPSVAPPASLNKDQAARQESKGSLQSSLPYVLIGTAIFFHVLSLSAAIFICYCSRITSIVVPLSSSRQLQTETTILGDTK